MRKIKVRAQICRGDSRPRIPPSAMASSAMGFKLAIFEFLTTTRNKNLNKCIHNLSALGGVLTHIYLYAQTAVDAGDTHLTNHGYFENEKPKYT